MTGSTDLTLDEIGRRRCCCTTTSTAACARPRDRAGRGDGHELPTTDEARRARRWFTTRADSGTWSATSRPSPHRRRDADRALSGSPRVRRGPGRRRRRLRRGALRARAAPRAGAHARRGRRAVQAGFREGRRAPRPAHDRVRQLLTAMRHAGPLHRDRRAGRRHRDRASSASTSPAARRATRPPATSTRSSTSSARTSTSPSTPARRSGCRRSGRRSSGAAPTGSATASASSTTSRSTTTGAELGRLAAYVRDKRVPLEMCPTSNVQTGAATRSPSTRSGC
jgi:hypothetical protein